MKRPLEKAGAMALALLFAAPAPAMSNEGWPRCMRDDDCPGFHLNVVTRQGEAIVSVGRSCAGAWRHVWRVPDARGTILQWLDENAAVASGSLCIPLHPNVDKIRITSTGGHCGFEGDGTIAFASKPGDDVVLRRSYGAVSSTTLPGCHARIGNKEIGEVAYGGIALDFSDGFGFGDSYATGYFYGVYDGLGIGRVRPFRATVYAISEFNTYHYRVEILANAGMAGLGRILGATRRTVDDDPEKETSLRLCRIGARTDKRERNGTTRLRDHSL